MSGAEGGGLGPPISTERIHEGTIVNLRRSEYRRPDGSVVTREVMDHPGAVVMVPVEGDHVLMVRQPREAVEEFTLELPAGTQVPLCAGPAPNHGFTDLLHAVRAHQKRSGPQPLFMPFLPEGLAGIARRTLGDTLGPNRHAHYGHSFGSDPWIGLAEWLRTRPPAADQPVTLGAFAYDGYYTVGSVCVGPWTQVELRADCQARCHAGGSAAPADACLAELPA